MLGDFDGDTLGDTDGDAVGDALGPGLGDLDGDGTAATADLLVFLSAFGQTCL